MPKLIVLGTAASVPDAEHDTVGLALHTPEGTVLIDCGGSPLYRLACAGVDLDEIRAVVLSHRHADHLYGLPMLVQGLWLAGREAPLPIYGSAEALNVAHKLLELFSLVEREGIFAIESHSVPPREGQRVLNIGSIGITSAPVAHGKVTTLALRLDNTATGRAVVYSADTEPCSALVRLAAGADLLLHEATGEHDGHSSPAEAAEIAREAGVGQLALIHYPVRGVNLEGWRQQAAGFPGPVVLARDGDIYLL
jgi:ribonuclease Z